jgi:hypothetical protein
VVALYNTLTAIAEARKVINDHVLTDGMSHRVCKTDTKRYVLLCKDKSCSFTMQAQCTKKIGVTIT